MNIEGEVKLGYRNELTAIEDADERIAEYERSVSRRYQNAKTVIYPAETRSWIANSLRRLPPTPARTGKKHPYIDIW